MKKASFIFTLLLFAFVSFSQTTANPDFNSIGESSIKVSSESSGSSFNLLSNDIGDNLVIEFPLNSTEGFFGTLIISDSTTGAYDYFLDNSSVVELSVGETLMDVFNYTIIDTVLNTESSSTLTITIVGGNSVPVAIADSNSMTIDTDIITENDGSGSLLINDIDNDASDVLAVVSVNASSGSTVFGNYGVLQWNLDGSYVYGLDKSIPEVMNLNESETLTDRFEYQVSDGNGGLGSAFFFVVIKGVLVSGLEGNTNHRIQIVPNPAKGFVKLNNVSGEIEQVEVLDIQGQLVLSKSNLTESVLSLENLTEGFYFIIVRNKEGDVFKESFIKAE